MTTLVTPDWAKMDTAELADALRTAYLAQPGHLVEGESWYRLDARNLTNLGMEISGRSRWEVTKAHTELLKANLWAKTGVAKTSVHFIRPTDTVSDTLKAGATSVREGIEEALEVASNEINRLRAENARLLEENAALQAKLAEHEDFSGVASKAAALKALASQN